MRIYKEVDQFKTGTDILIIKQFLTRPTHLHSHDFVEILYVTNGEGTHTVNGVEYPMNKNSLFIVDVNQTHIISTTDFVEYYNIFCKKSFLSELTVYSNEGQSAYSLLHSHNDVNFFPFEDKQSDTVKFIIEQLLFETISKTDYHDNAKELLINMLILELKRSYTTEQLHSSNNRPANTLPRIIDYVNQHFTEPIKINSLSAQYNYNPTYLGRLFCKTYGVPLKDYIFNKRIEYAANLLITSNEPIDVIIFKSGFSNKNIFYKAFLKVFSCTPKEYRNSVNENDNHLAL